MSPILVQQCSHHSELNVPMVGETLKFDGKTMLLMPVRDYVTALISETPQQDGCGVCACYPCCC